MTYFTSYFITILAILNVTQLGSNYRCHSYQYTCHNRRCVPSTSRCNGHNDCGDGSDEYHCSVAHTDSSQCHSYQYTCHNRRCVSVTSLCNGHNDCGDRSDEYHCPVAHTGLCIPILEYRCHNHKCIPLLYVCNGNNDCGDNSDETTCTISGKTTPTRKPSAVSTSRPTTAAPIITFRVRLVNGRNAMEGRVEVLYNGVWGTVCDDAWDDDDAKVVCRMLGYDSRSAIHTSKARFGSGVGPIYLDETQCSGQETNLDQCTFVPIDHGDCDHSEDAGVICQSGQQTTTTATTTSSTSGKTWIAIG